MTSRRRLGVLASHAIQYHAPIFRELARATDLHVFFGHRQTPAGQAEAGFGVDFEWDVALHDGYEHTYLHNVAARPAISHFRGCDTPGVGDAVRSGHFDAFLVMGWNLKCYWQAVRACRAAGIPVMVRGDSQLNTPRSAMTRVVKRLAYPPLLRQFDACLYVGERSKDYFREYGVPAHRLFHSPHCVDVTRFAAEAGRTDREQLRRELGILEGMRVLMFSGRLVAMKHPADLLSAAALVQSRGAKVHVLVVGDGPLRQGLADMARRLGVPSTFAGFWNQSRLPCAYAVADALVLPSDGRETWGLVVNEALACGIPAVVSDEVGCAPDLVHPGASGEVFRSGDVQGMAEAIERVFMRPKDDAAIRRISNGHSPDAAARGILAAMHAQYPKGTH
jgi:glycosyltransferase involved in cell wall biosynthesis